MSTKSLKVWAEIAADVDFVKHIMVKAKIMLMRSKRLPENTVILAEKDFKEKKKIVQKYRARWDEYTKQNMRRMEDFIEEAPALCDRDDIENIKCDMYFCLYAYGFAPDEYIFFNLENKSYEERISYVSNKERIEYAFMMNDITEMQKFNDKFETYALLKDYYQRECIGIEKQNDYNAFLSFIEKHPVFVKKLVDQDCGRSVELIDAKQWRGSEKEKFNELIAQGKSILEERIIQSQEMSLFNSSSLNTIRITTFNTRHGIVPSHAFLKNGRSGSFVDNAGAGGVVTGIDVETGVIFSNGYDEHGNVFECHPDSGIRYKGYRLPDWNQAIDLVVTISKKFPKTKYIGWDLGHTEKGWIVVEGNMAGQMVCQQMTLQRGFKEDILKIMEDVDLIAEL